MKSLLLILAIAAGGAANAQSNSVKDWVESQNYTFQAQTALPLSGRVRNLTPDFDLKVTREKVVSYLPYYGQAYVAPMDPSKSGLDFTTKDFAYTTTPGRKDGWTVTIKPRDYKEVQMMTLTISSKGYATLQVLRTSAQAISYNGVIVGK